MIGLAEIQMQDGKNKVWNETQVKCKGSIQCVSRFLVRALVWFRFLINKAFRISASCFLFMFTIKPMLIVKPNAAFSIFTNCPLSPPRILKKRVFMFGLKRLHFYFSTSASSVKATAVPATEDLESSGRVFPRRNVCYRCTVLPVAAPQGPDLRSCQDCPYLS